MATLGAYYDLEGVIQAVTTGGSTVDDRFIPWEGHPIAGETLAARALYDLLTNDDPLVPYAEVSRFQAEMPDARTSTVQLLRHVDFDPTSPSGWWPLAPDLWNMWHFTTWILAG